MFTLLASVTLMALIATVCLHVAWLLTLRARVEQAMPVRLLGLFWYGVGTYTLLDLLWTLALMVDVGSVVVGQVVLQLKLISSIAGFAGLVSYLLFIYTGKRSFLGAVGAGYVVLYAATVYHYSIRAPVAQELSAWGARLVYANPQAEPLWTLVVLGLFVPPALAAVAYASLLRFVREPATRYRLVVVGAGLIVFFAPQPLGWISGSWTWWPLVERSLALASALLVLTAFRPSTWARERFGARPMLDDPTAWRGRERILVHRPELLARVRELV